MKKSSLKRGTTPLKRTPMKRSSTRKRTNTAYHASMFTQACRGEPCFLRVPGVCMGDAGRETVVPAHSNQMRHGKGMGIKAHDEYTVPGCHACHYEIDQGNIFSREEKFAFWDAAYSAWVPVREKKLSRKNNPATVCAVPGLHSHTL